MSTGDPIRLTKEVRERLQKLATKSEAEFAKALVRSAQTGAGVVAQEAIDRAGFGKGGLARSWLSGVQPIKQRDGGMSVMVKSDLIYARVRDEGTGYLPGGVITSSRPGGHLAIPAKGASTRAQRSWPREWPAGALTFVPSRKTSVTGVLISNYSRKVVNGAEQLRGRVEYVLKKSVKQDGNRYYTDSLPEVEDAVVATLEDAADDLIEGGI